MSDTTFLEDFSFGREKTNAQRLKRLPTPRVQSSCAENDLPVKNAKSPKKRKRMKIDPVATKPQPKKRKKLNLDVFSENSKKEPKKLGKSFPKNPKDLSLEHLNVRYTLSRNLHEKKKSIVAVLCCNPSSATQLKDDQTSGWLTRNLKDRDWGRMQLFNMFPYRTPNQKLLAHLYDVDVNKHVEGKSFFKENQEIVETCIHRADAIILAFGSPAGIGVKSIMLSFLRKVNVIIERRNLLVGCFGRNPDGSPRHPAYLRRYSQDERNKKQPIIEFPLHEYLQAIARDEESLLVGKLNFSSKKKKDNDDDITSILDWTNL